MPPTPRRQVFTIDCEYTQPQFAAAYLVVDGPHAAFIDNNTANAVPILLETLAAQGLQPEQVDYVIITHVHLDHAGGTSQLMKYCPNAKLLAHPRAARHMINPAKLVASAREVYGAEAFDRMYGRIEPIDASRVQTVEDETLISFGQGAPLRFFHTRGHANHHFCILDPETKTVFTGDSFGLAYPQLQRQGLFIIPTTSPTDFDYNEALLSIDKIVATQAQQACVTHFGPVIDLENAALQLREHLRFSQDLMKEVQQSALPDSELTAYCQPRLLKNLIDLAAKQGLKMTPEDLKLLEMDIELNAQGLAHVAVKQRK